MKATLEPLEDINYSGEWIENKKKQGEISKNSKITENNRKGGEEDKIFTEMEEEKGTEKVQKSTKLSAKELRVGKFRKREKEK